MSTPVVQQNTQKSHTHTHGGDGRVGRGLLVKLCPGLRRAAATTQPLFSIGIHKTAARQFAPVPPLGAAASRRSVATLSRGLRCKQGPASARHHPPHHTHSNEHLRPPAPHKVVHIYLPELPWSRRTVRASERWVRGRERIQQRPHSAHSSASAGRRILTCYLYMTSRPLTYIVVAL